MPFNSLINGGGGVRDLFSEGLTNETIAQLVRICAPAVGVIARSSVRLVGDEGKTVGEIARMLEVDYLLEGTVRTAAVGDLHHGVSNAGGVVPRGSAADDPGAASESQHRVRITSQLIDAGDETHVWADVYDRALDDVLAVQNEVAGLIARAVAGRLAPASP